jgi:uncharacterized membrane protein
MARAFLNIISAATGNKAREDSDDQYEFQRTATAHLTAAQHKEQLFGLFDRDKIQSLTDTFFIVAFSLVVLDLKVPRSDSKLANEPSVPFNLILNTLGQVGVTFVFTLLNLGIFWVVYKQIVKHSNHTIGKNFFILSLFFFAGVLFMPFTHQLIYVYPNEYSTIVIYAAVAGFISFLQLTLLVYIWSAGRVQNIVEASIHNKLIIQKAILILAYVILGYAAFILHITNFYLLFIPPIMFTLIDFLWGFRLRTLTRQLLIDKRHNG